MTHEELERITISMSSRISYLEGQIRALLEHAQKTNIKLEEMDTRYWELKKKDRRKVYEQEINNSS